MTVIILDWDFSHYYQRVDERYLTLDEAVEQVKVHERQNKSIKAQIANKVKALVANKAIKALVAEPRSDEELKQTLTDLRDNTAELGRIKRHLHALINAGVEALPQPDPRLFMPEHQRALYKGLEWFSAKNEWMTESNKFSEHNRSTPTDWHYKLD
jgi:outer membrane protein TolC